MRFPGGKAPLGRYCPNRRERGKSDPSRAGGVPGRLAAGRGDRGGPPGFAGGAGWRPAVVAGALSAGSGRRSIGGPGHNEDRSRTPGHSSPPGKPGGAVALRGPASPPFRRTGQPRLRRASAILSIERCSVGSFGPALTKRAPALGDSLTDVMRKPDVDSTRGATYARWKNQTERLFRSTVEFSRRDEAGERFIASRIADRGEC